jgi:MscS family membrane protein
MRLISFIFAACFMLYAHLAIAEPTNEFKVADTSSPRDTLRSFIEAANDTYDLIKKSAYVDRNNPEAHALATRILDCIDASALPAFARRDRAADAAAALKEILDRVELPPWDEIPGASEIQAAGGHEELSRWRIPKTRITIERAQEGSRKHEYQFSPGTVQRAVEYYRDIRDRPYRTDGPRISPGLYDWHISAPGHPVLGAIVEQLPASMRFGRTLGLANWKWPTVLLLLGIAIATMWVLYSLQFSATRRVSPQNRLRYGLTLFFPIAAMLVPLAFLEISHRYLTVRNMPLHVISFGSQLVAIVAAVVVIFLASTRVAESIIASPKIKTYGRNAQVIRISSTLVAILIAVVVLITGGQYLGIPIGTLLASAGIGGIALALGAQDTLKNVFATINLMSDPPFRVGERITFGGYEGTVEDMSLRSTDLRLLDGHLVTIPNQNISGQSVENISRRKYIRKSSEIHIASDTPYEKVEKAIAIIREKLTGQEIADPEHPPRCFLHELGPLGFSIRFIYCYSPPDTWAFHAFGEKLNLEIFRAFEAEGIQLVRRGSDGC